MIRFTPGANDIHTSVTVNGQRGTFLVDTGASYTVLSIELGLTLSSKILVHAVGGVAAARLAIAGAVEVQGARATDVPVVVMDDLSPRAFAEQDLVTPARRLVIVQIALPDTAGLAGSTLPKFLALVRELL